MISDEAYKAIGVVATAVAAIAVPIILWMLNRNTKITKEIKVDIDGRLQELLELTRKAAKAEGKKEEHDENKKKVATEKFAEELKEINKPPSTL